MAKNTGTNRLPNSFFKINPLMEYSASIFEHFTITSRGIKEVDKMFNDVAAQCFSETRMEKMRQDRQSIEQTDDPAELVEFMRAGHDSMNRGLLCSKILALHDQTMPLILRRYRTCALDEFIDTATEVFATGNKKYVQMLREMYRDIRCPFAQASACLVFGMQGMKEEIPFLLSEYERFQREYPDETFDQHPLLALYILHGKSVYISKNK